MSSDELHRHGDMTASLVQALLDGDLLGEVCGIGFDLRPPGLDLAEWRPGTLPTNLLFPWNGPQREADWLPGEVGSVSMITVSAGDKVFIGDVTAVGPSDVGLLDSHDVQEMQGHLSVRRASGEVKETHLILTFARPDAMRAYSPHQRAGFDPGLEAQLSAYGITFTKIRARARRLHKAMPTTHGGLIIRRHPEHAELLALAHDLAEKLDLVIERLDEGQRLAAAEVAELAGGVGYAVGRAESTARLEPWARKALKARSDQREAVELAKIANTKDDTPQLVRDAQEMCAANSNLALTRCSKVLGDRYGREPSNVRPLIRHLFEARTLPSGRLEYRPKRRG